MRLLVILPLAVTLLLSTACSTAPTAETKPRALCSFEVLAEASDVIVSGDGVPTIVTTAGEGAVLQSACAPLRLTLSKPCYPSVDVVLSPGSDPYTIREEEWEKYGYLRFDNLAKHQIYVDGFPDGRRLTVAEGSHGSKAVPLGTQTIVVSADWKNELSREVRVCEESEVVAFEIDSSGPAGDLVVASPSTPLVLEHGVGSLRVTGGDDDHGLIFTIREAESSPSDLLKKLGVEDLTQVDLEQVSEHLRWIVKLVKEAATQTYRVPTVLVLPAGRYRLEIVGAQEESSFVEAQVLPSSETLLQLAHQPVG